MAIVLIRYVSYHVRVKYENLHNIYTHTVRRSSTKKSDYFTKRYSQPQLETGKEFTCPKNHPHQHSTPLTVSPTEHVRPDAKCGLETDSGNKHKPYLNRRSQLYRFSCDDYHSGGSDTLAFENTCILGGAAGKVASDVAVTTAAAIVSAAAASATVTTTSAIDDEPLDWNKMQSDTELPSSSSSAAAAAAIVAQNPFHTENVGTEPIPTNVIDLATDNLPAVDTPDACDKAALR